MNILVSQVKKKEGTQICTLNFQMAVKTLESCLTTLLFNPPTSNNHVFLSLNNKNSFAGYEWVGWRNDSSGMGGRPVEIVFEFDRVRNFSAMYIHTNNLFSKDVQVRDIQYNK